MPLWANGCNNHHIEVNLKSRDDMVCGPPTTTQKTMQLKLGYRLNK